MSDEQIADPPADAPMFGDSTFATADPLTPPERLSFLRIARALQAAGADLDDDAIANAAGGGPFAIPATGPIPDVVDGQIIESAWGNAIRDRSVTPFDSITAANAAGGPGGSICITRDTGALYVRGGNAWLPIGAGFSGTNMLKTQPGTAQTAISASQTIVSLALPTAPFGRWVEAYGVCRIDSESAAAGVMGMRLESGAGTMTQAFNTYPATAGSIGTFTLYQPTSLAANTAFSVNMVAFRQSGTVTGKTYADGTMNRLTLIAQPYLS